MALLDILIYPHPALTTPGHNIEVVDDEVRMFLDDLVTTMYDAQGIGLAANQVADLRRICVIDIGNRDTDAEYQPGRLLELVNPKVVAREGKIKWEEGCLSFPELYEMVERSNWVRVEHLDRDGEPQSVEGEGLLAVALQHEIDHLDGIVFTEKMSRLRKLMALKRFKKIMKERA